MGFESTTSSNQFIELQAKLEDCRAQFENIVNKSADATLIVECGTRAQHVGHGRIDDRADRPGKLYISTVPC